MRYRNFSLIAFCCFLFSCSSNSYKPQGFFGDGYTDFRITENKFMVVYRGNASTPPELTYKYALIRAAEITIDNNFFYFVILSEKDISKQEEHTYYTSSKTEPVLPNSPASEGDKGIKEADYISSKHTSQYIVPGTEIQIRCYKEKPEDMDAIDAYDFVKYNKRS